MDTIRKRQEDATSKETLEDLAEVTTDTEPDETDGLSPDAAFDDEESLKDADPV